MLCERRNDAMTVAKNHLMRCLDHIIKHSMGLINRLWYVVPQEERKKNDK